MSARAALRGVDFSYGGREVLRGLELELIPGELVVLLGPNGAGKSTLLELLSGALRPARGEVRLEGQDPALLSRAEAARRVAYLPARARVPDDYLALEVVLMARYPFGRGLLLERPGDVALAREALAQVDALAFAERSAASLSSGEQQRVLLARLLCQATGPGAPDLLLLDEPSSAQDLAHELALFALFRRLAVERGQTLLLASHALNAAAQQAHRLVVLGQGRVLAAGPPATVLTAELLAEAFGVEALIGAAEAPYVIPLRPVDRPNPER